MIERISNERLAFLIEHRVGDTSETKALVDGIMRDLRDARAAIRESEERGARWALDAVTDCIIPDRDGELSGMVERAASRIVRAARERGAR